MSMKPTFATRMTRVTRRALTGTAVLCGAAVLSGTALTALPGAAQAATATAASPAGTSPAWSPKCTSQQTEIWLGLGLGSGTAGTIFYPVEFANAQFRPPRLLPVGLPEGGRDQRLRAPDRQVLAGAAAAAWRGRAVPPWLDRPRHAGHRRGGQRAGSHPVGAASLRIRAPHQRASTDLPFGFQACHGKRVLVFGPIVPGVGIP